MERLSSRERELAAIGAAIASNCIPCIKYHIPAARKAGLSDSQILEAVRLADEVRRVPAGKVLHAATGVLEVPGEQPAGSSGASCGGLAATGDDRRRPSCCDES